MAARITLAGAPIVVEKRKRINVRLNGPFAGGLAERTVGQKDILTLDMQKQGISDIEYLLKYITIEETRLQLKVNNEPSRLAVDNKEGKPLHAVKRKTEVTYGNILEQAMIKHIERSLMSAIRTLAVRPEHKALGSMASWEWLAVSDPKSSKVAVPVNVYKLAALPVGSYLLLKPKSNLVGVANSLAARKDAGWPSTPGRSGGRGFMAQSMDKVKRSNLLKNYTIHTIFTSRFAVAGETYRQTTSATGPMTPVLVLRAKRNRRYRKIV